MGAADFLDRVMPHLTKLPTDKFNHTSWRYENRPTSEGVGILPAQVNLDIMASCILDAEHYPENVKYVESVEIVDRRSPTDVSYIQRMSLPVLGKMQVQIDLAEIPSRDGWRIIAWDQNDAGTEELDKKQGARTAYNLGAWLLRDDAIAYALSSAPVKKDVGTLKYMAMTKGADAMASDVLKQNIEGMIAWAERS
ncbi:MAG: hypothetical protein K0U60_10120 [Actinomycetia bacterium]|nr:hypothetical protein [Actinomycetes bacterium]MCH9800751.1 hypothetical protein [Actinomycetes bacterium]